MADTEGDDNESTYEDLGVIKAVAEIARRDRETDMTDHEAVTLE